MAGTLTLVGDERDGILPAEQDRVIPARAGASPQERRQFHAAAAGYYQRDGAARRGRRRQAGGHPVP